MGYDRNNNIEFGKLAQFDLLQGDFWKVKLTEAQTEI